MQYPPPSAGAPATAPTGKGHGAFSEEEIAQICAETGYSYDQVCQDIDRSNATSKEQLYPQFYTGEGIQPPAETVGPGVVQGAPPPDARAQAQAAMQGSAAPPVMAPAEAGTGEVPQGAPMEDEGIPPEIAQAMHTAMAPPTRKRTRR